MTRDEIKINVSFKMTESPHELFKEFIKNNIVYVIKDISELYNNEFPIVYCDIIKCDDKKFLESITSLIMDTTMYSPTFGLFPIPADPEDYSGWEIYDPAIDRKKFPHVCTFCKSPAYIDGLMKIKCSTCKGTY